MKTILISLTFLLFSATAYSQFYLEKGDNYFYHNNFPKALNNYLKAFEENQKEYRFILMDKIAETNKRMGQLKESEKWYRKLYNAKTNSPDYMWKFAKALQGIGKYKEAQKIYLQYQKTNPPHNLGLLNAAYCDSLINWLDTSIPFSYIKNPKPFNSVEREIAPTVYKDGIVFESSRAHDLYKKPWFRSIYASRHLDYYFLPVDPTKNEWEQTPEHFTVINSRHHEGPACFSKNDEELFYTRPVPGHKYNRLHLHPLNIFYRKYENGEWTKPHKNYHFNSSLHSTGHPCLSEDGKTLFMMIDKVYGLGGSDIYYSFKEKDGSWSEPINLGNEVNTKGNELFPELSKDGTLYFSSDGHPGFGGLDLYSADYNTKTQKWGNVKNLKNPINSSFDDFGISFYKSSRMGFFSSNREKGVGLDDIYSFIFNQEVIYANGRVLTLEDSRLFDDIVYTADSLSLLSRNGFFEFQTIDNMKHDLIALKKDSSYNHFYPIIKMRPTDTLYSLALKSKIREAQLYAKARNSQGDSMPNAKVWVFDGDILLDTIPTDASGNYAYKVNPGHDYQFLIGDDYMQNRIRASCFTYLRAKILAEGRKVGDVYAEILKEDKELVFSQLLDSNQYLAYRSRCFTMYRVKANKEGYYPIDTLVKTTNQDVTLNLRLMPMNAMTITGTLVSKGKPLDSADVAITHSNGKKQIIKADSLGRFTAKVYPNDKYNITASKKGHFNVDTTFSTKKLDSTKPNQSFVAETEPITKGKVMRLNNIYFEYDKSRIMQQSKPNLQKLADFIDNNPNLIIEISTHTDNRASDAYNFDLSVRRAEEVVKYLGLTGTDITKLSAKGYGETLPMIPDAQNETEHAINRRAEFKILDIIDDAAPPSLSYIVVLMSFSLDSKAKGIIRKKFPSFQTRIEADGNALYFVGAFNSLKEAENIRKQALRKGYKKAFVQTLKNGEPYVSKTASAQQP